MFFCGSGDVRYVRDLSRQRVADADCERCIALLGEICSAIGVSICDDRDCSTDASHGVSVPFAHHSGTDYGGATLRPRRHETVADTTDSRCVAESS